MCYFYKESQIFELIWSNVFHTRNCGDIQPFWSNCNLLGVRGKSSSHVCINGNVFFLKKAVAKVYWFLYFNIQCCKYKKMSITRAKNSLICEKVPEFGTAMVLCPRFIRITNSSDHRRIWTANLLHTKLLPNPLGHKA